jgi:ketosteroid isomerase-like protein
MSRENVELARRTYEAWNVGDRQGWLDTLDPGVELTTSGIWPDFDPVYRGHEGAARFYDQINEAWEYFRVEPQGIVEEGTGLGVAVLFRGKGAGSGVEVELEFHHGLHIRDGLIDHLASRRTLAEALEAAGLRESVS